MVKFALSSFALAVLCATAPLASAAPCDHPFRTSSVHRCTFADFDGDGKVDVASFGTSAEPITPLSVSLSRSEQTANRALPLSAAAIRVFDVDGDHDVDLVVSAADRRIVQVLLNSGYGSFEDDPLNRLVGDRDDDPISLQTPVEDESDSAAALFGGASVDFTGRSSQRGRYREFAEAQASSSFSSPSNHCADLRRPELPNVSPSIA